MFTAVDRIYGESREIISRLKGVDEISLALSAEDVLRKSLLLASASYFEHQLTNIVADFVASRVGRDDMVPALVKTKVISRQYHTWFNWDSSNANSFYGLFGERFKAYMKEEMDRDARMVEGVASFLKLGSERNRLVHQDFSSFNLGLTAEEIYEHYERSKYFVSRVPSHLKACAALVSP